MDALDVQQFCHELPKVELHAHLNTSYSAECLQELLALYGDVGQDSSEQLCIASNKDIDESFLLFTKIQKLVTTEDAVYLLTRKVIIEFAQDNVKYLELRSTPKCIESTGMTRELYIRTMIRAVKDCEKEGLDIIVRLLPSIDRRLGIEVAQITVDLAYKMMKESNGLVIGIDFSGDPKVGNAEDYIPVFLDAGKKGLKLALHLAELPLHEETSKVLKSCAEYISDIRIGHGTFLHRYDQGLGHEQIEKFVSEHRIPIVVNVGNMTIFCNVAADLVKKLSPSNFDFDSVDHFYVTEKETDGKGAYASTLSEEYVKAAKAFNLSKKDLKCITVASVECIFDSQDVKNKFKESFSKFDIE